MLTRIVAALVFSKAQGDESKANSIYIELRKQSLIDEHVVKTAAAESAAQEREAQESKAQSPPKTPISDIPPRRIEDLKRDRVFLSVCLFIFVILLFLAGGELSLGIFPLLGSGLLAVLLLSVTMKINEHPDNTEDGES